MRFNLVTKWLHHTVRVFIVIPCLLAWATPAFGQPKVENAASGSAGEVVGPRMENPTDYTISRRGLSVACAYGKGSRVVVQVNGVESPKFDGLINAALARQPNTLFARTDLRQPQAVLCALSDDGSRYAYAGRIGQEMVVIVDGKEHARHPMDGTGPPFVFFGFSPGEKSSGGARFFTVAMAQRGPGTLTIEGAEPIQISFPMVPWFSPDGKQFVVKTPVGGGREKGLFIVDGKPMDAFDGEVGFTREGKLFTLTRPGQNAGAATPALITLDGKVLASSAAIKPIDLMPNVMEVDGLTAQILCHQTPSGDVYTNQYLADQSGKFALHLNGKPVPGTTEFRNAAISPDGKRFAVTVGIGNKNQVVADGKSGPEFEQVSQVQFSADSKRVVYLAQSNRKHFVVVDDEESDAFDYKPDHFALAPVGSRYVFVALEAGKREQSVFVDGKPHQLTDDVRTDIQYSPDGKRMAYSGFFQKDGTNAVVLDQKVYPLDITDGTKSVAFSPDSKWAFTAGLVERDRIMHGRPGILLNEKLIASPKDSGTVVTCMFSPDSKHLIWITGGSPANSGRAQLFVDGALKAEFDSPLVTPAFKGPAMEWNGDGTLSLLALDGDSLRRLTVKFDDSTSVQKYYDSLK